MIGPKTILFLFGTFALVSSKAFLPMVGVDIAKASTGMLIDKESPGAPFISNFIQEGTNIFFKPHFTMNSHVEQPQAMIVENKNCNEVPLVPAPVLTPPAIEEGLRIVETVIPSNDFEPPHVKEVIDIKPLLPEVVMSAPVLVPELTAVPEATILSLMPLPELPEPVIEALVPELPTLSMPIEPLPMPAIVEEPIMIPETPVLPSFTMPELPALTVIEAQPLIPEIPAPLEPAAVMVEEPMFIPEAPILPPMKMPEIPTVVEAMPDPIPYIIEEPMVMPEAPVLPALVMPEIPESINVEEPVPLPIVPALEPVVIPEAPVLPPFIMPELPNPTVIEVMSDLPVFTPIEPPSIIVEEPAVIPEAPLLPPLAASELPSNVIIEEKIPVQEFKFERPVLVPTAPLYPEQPCVYPFTFPCPVGPYPNPVGVPSPYVPLTDVPQTPIMPFIPPMPQVPIHSERIEINKVIMSSLPSSLSFPTDCVQNIIAERVLPNMVGQAVVASPALTNPVPAPYIRL